MNKIKEFIVLSGIAIGAAFAALVAFVWVALALICPFVIPVLVIFVAYHFLSKIW